MRVVQLTAPLRSRLGSLSRLQSRARKQAVLFLLAAALGCSNEPQLPSYGVVPDFDLVDQTGEPFHSKQALDGHVWVANFIFTTCMGPCPRMSAQMKQVRDASAELDARLVSFTIDPERDTPEVLSQYGKRFGAAHGRWYFLTGPMKSLDRMSFDVFKLGRVDGQLEHSSRFVLIDRKSRIRGYYDTSDPANVTQLIADLKALAAAGA
jgi:protein SCO1/2